jgi:hypothetical protein
MTTKQEVEPDRGSSEYTEAAIWLDKKFRHFLSVRKRAQHTVNRFTIPEQKLQTISARLAFEDFKDALERRDYKWTEIYDPDSGEDIPEPDIVLLFW